MTSSFSYFLILPRISDWPSAQKADLWEYLIFENSTFYLRCSFFYNNLLFSEKVVFRKSCDILKILIQLMKLYLYNCKFCRLKSYWNNLILLNWTWRNTKTNFCTKTSILYIFLKRINDPKKGFYLERRILIVLLFEEKEREWFLAFEFVFHLK